MLTEPATAVVNLVSREENQEKEGKRKREMYRASFGFGLGVDHKDRGGLGIRMFAVGHPRDWNQRLRE